MKKLTVLLLSFLCALSCLYSSSTSFDIKAYKLSEDQRLKIEVTSAIPGNLVTVEDHGTINMTPIKNSLLGRSDTEIANFGEHVIFSYRVWGGTKDKGTYTLTMSFSSLNHTTDGYDDSAGNTGEGTRDFINASYELGNISYVFPDVNDDEYGNSKIEPDENTTSSVPIRIETHKQSSNNELVAKWKVAQSNNQEQRWIARGAVATNIDTETYDAAKNGIYKAQCTITLEVE